MTISATGTEEAPVPLPVRSAANNPDGDTLEVALPDQPDIGSTVLDVVTGDPLFTIPTGRANQDLFVPFAVQPVGVPARRSRGTALVGTRAVVVPPPPPTGGYDYTLPYGGLGDGITTLMGGPGNAFGNNVTMNTCYPLEHIGTLQSISWNHRIDAFGKSTGYSKGTGGSIRIEVWTMTNAPGDNRPILGTKLGQTATYSGLLARNTAWNRSWMALGGASGTMGDEFWEYPTIFFEPTIDLAAAGRVIDPTRSEGYVIFVWRNLDSNPAANYVSVNHNFADQNMLEQNASYRHYRYLRASVKNSDFDHRWIPFMAVGYTDGRIKGPAWQGPAFEPPAIHPRLSNGSGAIRQVIPVRRAGVSLHRVTTFHARLNSTGTAGSLRLRVRRADVYNVPSTSTDDGTIVYEGTLPISSLPYGGSSLKTNGQPPAAYQTFVLPNPLPLANQTTYYYELTSTGDTVLSYLEDDTLDRAERGLRWNDAMSATPRMRGQQYSSGAWRDIPGHSRGERSQYISLFASYVA